MVFNANTWYLDMIENHVLSGFPFVAHFSSPGRIFLSTADAARLF